jgi:hypothetical protein
MKYLLTILLALWAFIGFSQVKNYTIEGTKWVKTPMLILGDDTIEIKEVGDTLLTTEKWRILSALIKSGYDSSRFNTSDGYIYHYISSNVSDSTLMDGRYRLLSDTTYNMVYDDFAVSSVSINITYPITFNTSDYFFYIFPYYVDTIGSDIFEVGTSNTKPVLSSTGFTCDVSAETTNLRYWAADSSGVHTLIGEHDPTYAADSADIKSSIREIAADTAGWNAKQNALTNPVTGTGTTNYLPKFSGASTLANSAFKDDGTVATLEQNSVQPFTSEVSEATDNTLYLKAGNVGIGTTAPAGKLSVATAGGENDIFADTYSATTGHSNVLFSRKSASDTNGVLAQTADLDYLGAFYFQGVNTASAFAYGAKIYAKQNGVAGTYIPTDLNFSTYSATAQNSNQLVLSTNGNVGIGTTAPVSKLTIYDGSFVNTYNSIHGIYLDNAGITGADGAFGAGIEFGKLGTTAIKKAAIVPVQNGADTDQMGLSFFVSNSETQAVAMVEAMRIAYQGNVGIGTNAPISKLAVGGSVATNLNLFNYINSDVNKIRTTIAQATDTSSFHASSSVSGNITLHIVDKIGATQLQSDSTLLTVPKLKTTPITAALTDDTPTDTEIDTATGLTPATAGAGWECWIKDNNGSGLVYRIVSDGSGWYWFVTTLAL